MIDKLSLYFTAFPTVRYATVSLLLIAVCASLLGVTLVLKRFSMIGDGLSHVSFGTTAVATVLGLTTPIYLTLPLTVLSAVLLLKLGENTRLRGDAAIAMVSTGALALGYLLLNLFPSSAGAGSDACASLFGSGIIGIDLDDVIICSVLAAAVLFDFIFFYNRIFAVTFDESFATATGIHSGIYNTVVAITTGVIVVVAMNMVGALLVSALITFPALSAMRVFKTFKAVTVCSACISAACALVGIIVSLILAAPIGPMIVIADIIALGVCSVIGRSH